MVPELLLDEETGRLSKSNGSDLVILLRTAGRGKDGPLPGGFGKERLVSRKLLAMLVRLGRTRVLPRLVPL
jgi:hypothetical protein